MTAAMENDLVPFGLTMGDYEVLVHLSEAERPSGCGCATWPRALQLSPSGLTRRLDGLVPAGLVERVASPADRRVMLARSPTRVRAKLRRAAPGPRRQRAQPPPQPARRATQSCSSAPSSTTVRANLLPTRAPPVTALPAGLRRPRRQHRHQGRHRRLRGGRRRRAVCRGRRVHDAAASPGRAWSSAGAPRRRPGPGGRRRLQERQRRHRRRRAGRRHARSSPASPARLGCAPADVLIASTGVIGRHYPIDRIRAGIAGVRRAPAVRRRRAASRAGIMTTDTVAKIAAGVGRRPRASRRHRQGRRDDRAEHGDDDHRAAHRRRRRPRRSRPLFRAVVDRTFNCVSASTPTPRPATPRSCWPAAPPDAVDLDAFERRLVRGRRCR